MSDEENIVRRRPRRSTAGNRMQAALAETPIEDGSNDMEEDDDFIEEKEEEDVFESDFESTDDEATAQAEMVTGEKEVQEEERQARKQAKSKLEKITAIADARFRVTFNPDAASGERTYQKQKPRRRVSLGLTINAETGEVIATDDAAGSSVRDTPELSRRKTRQSQRKHTIQNTVETVKRLKSSEEKKATTPKKTKVVKRKYTQGELLARALDNEEGNIVEHRDYLILEEEKRKRAKVIRTVVEGPRIRWVSRLEQVQVMSQPSLPPPEIANALPMINPTPPSQTTHLHKHETSSTVPSQAPIQSNLDRETKQDPIAATLQPMVLQPPISALIHSPIPSSVVPTLTSVPHTLALTGQLQQAQPMVRNETIARNYVIHELGQRDETHKPNWTETMEAMFGDHVRWDEVRVYVGKGRPLSRPKHVCPITGKQALYMDPRTGVPYADVRAFEVLTGLLEHEYIWDPELGCYIGREEAGDV